MDVFTRDVIEEGLVCREGLGTRDISQLANVSGED